MTHDNIDILVVDDDISHCTILQALLRGWGYNVALANSGRQALEQVRERQPLPSLVPELVPVLVPEPSWCRSYPS